MLTTDVSDSRCAQFPRSLKENEWDGVLACNRDPPKCPQLSYPERNYEGDEDCLYLNVYTHRVWNEPRE